MAETKQQHDMAKALMKDGYTVIKPGAFGVRYLTHEDVKQALKELNLKMSDKEIDQLNYKFFEKQFSGDFSEQGVDQQHHLITMMIYQYREARKYGHYDIYSILHDEGIKEDRLTHIFAISFVHKEKEYSTKISAKTITRFENLWSDYCKQQFPTEKYADRSCQVKYIEDLGLVLKFPGFDKPLKPTDSICISFTTGINFDGYRHCNYQYTLKSWIKQRNKMSDVVGGAAISKIWINDKAVKLPRDNYTFDNFSKWLLEA